MRQRDRDIRTRKSKKKKKITSEAASLAFSSTSSSSSSSTSSATWQENRILMTLNLGWVCLAQILKKDGSGLFVLFPDLDLFFKTRIWNLSDPQSTLSRARPMCLRQPRNYDFATSHFYLCCFFLGWPSPGKVFCKYI